MASITHGRGGSGKRDLYDNIVPKTLSPFFGDAKDGTSQEENGMADPD